MARELSVLPASTGNRSSLPSRRRPTRPCSTATSAISRSLAGISDVASRRSSASPRTQRHVIGRSLRQVTTCLEQLPPYRAEVAEESVEVVEHALGVAGFKPRHGTHGDAKSVLKDRKSTRL